MFYCPPGYEVPVYEGRLYPSGHPDAPSSSVRPDRCFPSEGSARAAGATLVEPGAAAVASLSGTTILFGIGLSTDPFGMSRPHGAGLLSAEGTKLRSVELTVPRLAPDRWLPDGSVVVRRQVARRNPVTGRRTLVPRLLRHEADANSFGPGRPVPLPSPIVDASWSPDGSRIAYEPVRWSAQGYGSSGRVLVIDASGSERTFVARGHLAGWTPDGRIVIWSDRAMRDLIAVDPASGRRTLLLAGGEAEQLARVDGLGLGEPVFSRDGRFMATRVYGWPAGSRITAGILIATAGGRGVRLVTSRYLISMIAWSPAEDLLAYTTSGFPDPHELFIVGPAEEPRRLYEGPAHFDWVTWSPDGRWVLIDDEALDRWLLFKPKGSGRSPLWLPRLGGAPMWCCPQGAFAEALE